MSLFLDDGDVQLYHGDALAELALMPSESVQCIVTSPPFWGLRSYIDDDHADKPLEHGLEDTPDEWCARLVARRLGRHAIGIDLSLEYLAIAAKRLQQLSLLSGA